MDESERRYQELIRTSPAPINLFDASGEIIWGNDAVLDLLGLDAREELVGRSIFEFIHPEDRDTAEAELAAVVTEKEPTGPTTMQLTPAVGPERTIRVATAPGRYDGRDIGQAVILDVTELERLKTELRAETEFIETALDTIQDIFYVIDPAGELQRWNDTLLAVSGYNEAEVGRLAVEEFFVEPHRERVADSIARAFVEGTDVVEATVRTKTGEHIPYEFRNQRIEIEGSVAGLVGIGRDVTEQRTREQHLETADHLFQHHLRNRGNVIQGYADLMATGAEAMDEPASEPITEEASEAINEAVEDVLDLFRRQQEILSSILFEKERVTIDLVAVLEDLLANYERTHPNADLQLDAPSEAHVVAIPYIRQAFDELVWNAIKHNPGAAPTVSIRIDADRTPVRIRLEDDGPPISKHEYEFIRDPESLGSTSHPTGLGLWAANLAVRYSHGTFTVEERSANGNAICIELPSPPGEWSPPDAST
jgi:PAS domain S-box-containing protein